MAMGLAEGSGKARSQILATAHPKRQYYVLSPLGTAVHISLGLGAGSSELCRNGGKGGIVQVSEQRDGYGLPPGSVPAG